MPIPSGLRMATSGVIDEQPSDWIKRPILEQSGHPPNPALGIKSGGWGGWLHWRKGCSVNTIDMVRIWPTIAIKAAVLTTVLNLRLATSALDKRRDEQLMEMAAI
jgi:hypothetical protein